MGEPEETGETGGSYVLAIGLANEATIEVGALGPISFNGGTYAYVGSALGPGGFARIDRHREVAVGDRAVRHWHVDYLLGHPDSRLEQVVRYPGESSECELAARLPGEVVPDFGSTDCGCDGHLVRIEDDALVTTVRATSGVTERTDENEAGFSDRFHKKSGPVRPVGPSSERNRSERVCIVLLPIR